MQFEMTHIPTECSAGGRPFNYYYYYYHHYYYYCYYYTIQIQRYKHEMTVISLTLCVLFFSFLILNLLLDDKFMRKQQKKKKTTQIIIMNRRQIKNATLFFGLRLSDQ